MLINKANSEIPSFVQFIRGTNVWCFLFKEPWIKRNVMQRFSERTFYGHTVSTQDYPLLNKNIGKFIFKYILFAYSSLEPESVSTVQSEPEFVKF